jgi:hypothetical protein
MKHIHSSKACNRGANGGASQATLPTRDQDTETVMKKMQISLVIFVTRQVLF